MEAFQLAGKILASMFWNSGVIFIYYLNKGKTITGENYSALLDKVHKTIIKNRRETVSKMFLSLQDNVPAINFAICGRIGGVPLTYLPLLSSSDYYLFLKWKKKV